MKKNSVLHVLLFFCITLGFSFPIVAKHFSRNEKITLSFFQRNKKKVLASATLLLTLFSGIGLYYYKGSEIKLFLKNLLIGDKDEKELHYNDNSQEDHMKQNEKEEAIDFQDQSHKDQDSGNTQEAQKPEDTLLKQSIQQNAIEESIDLQEQPHKDQDSGNIQQAQEQEDKEPQLSIQQDATEESIDLQEQPHKDQESGNTQQAQEQQAQEPEDKEPQSSIQQDEKEESIDSQEQPHKDQDSGNTPETQEQEDKELNEDSEKVLEDERQ